MLDKPVAGFPPDVVASYRLHFFPRGPQQSLDLRLPEHVIDFLAQQISPIHRLSELLGSLFLDDAAQPIAYCLPYLGYLGQARIDPHMLLGPGPFLRAAGLILFHHQPGGDATLTRRHLRLARQVRDIGHAMRLHLLDLLLTSTDDRWTSLKRQNRLTFPTLGDPFTSAGLDGRTQVKPKYRNPENPGQTWSGRGRMALWLREKIEAGRRLEDFLVAEA